MAAPVPAGSNGTSPNPARPVDTGGDRTATTLLLVAGLIAASPVRARATRATATAALVTLAACVVLLAVWTGIAVGAAKPKQPSAPTTTTTAVHGTGNSAATDWVLQAIAATQKLGSVHITGAIKQGKSVIKLNLVLDGDGEGGGQFVEDGSPIKIDRIGALLYFNAPTKFWATHATPAQTKEYGGKWLEFSALDTRFASFDMFLDASDLVVAVFQGHTTPLTVSRPTTYDNRKVVVVKDVTTTKGKTTTSLMDIGATGTRDVYRIVDDTPSEDGTLVFSHYGKALAFTEPPEAINLSG